MHAAQAITLFITALLAGAINSVAGGGSFLTVPTLIITGVPAVPANATSTVALWPGSLASAGAYRRELSARGPFLYLTVIISLVGGILGAILLLLTPSSVFVRLLPFLLLGATLLFTFSNPLISWLRRGKPLKDPMNAHSFRELLPLGIAQSVIAIYGGYFGGGIGILMLATLSLMGMRQIHEMNALKTVLATCINGVAVLTFIIARAVVWPQMFVMLIGAVIGGYGGAAIARQLDPRLIRGVVIVIGFSMTAYFLFKY
jgi:uncharacterized protein